MGTWHGKLHKAAFRKIAARKLKKARFAHRYGIDEAAFRALPKKERHALRMKRQGR